MKSNRCPLCHFVNNPSLSGCLSAKGKLRVVWRGVPKERRQLVIGGVCTLGCLSHAANTEANAFIRATQLGGKREGWRLPMSSFIAQKD
ncbi:hypothetical protein CDAR_5831 [Caerostris darwini]|uniref:Uncharacterized protein n=1 Tax=Caerostris darwini TaxID=1538125 RepID=A0AAV4RHJ5_9ARAC|nr:hypothetical protein CDAR_5831 [Caerostris darwini]